VSISYLLVLLGLGVFGCAIWALFWAIDSGQYDDLEAQGHAIFDGESEAGKPSIALPGRVLKETVGARVPPPAD
jgi:cbb3-type cytochrome oxidase maturation protein